MRESAEGGHDDGGDGDAGGGLRGPLSLLWLGSVEVGLTCYVMVREACMAAGRQAMLA